ncbi:MAG: hypothetical protein LUM44_00140 [Pyrinomonadaceae bacterium]|nr:hypothetical protein [Pyrinomonadaceae bacterium]
MTKYIFVLISICVFCSVCFSQTKPKTIAVKKTVDTQTILPALKSSPAFAEISLRRAELRAEVESLLVNYTEEFPKVKEIRFELDVLNRELNRLLTVKTEESSKLTLALGKIIIRKAGFETDLWDLRKKYNDEHPDVKRALKKVEIFENSIKDILN